MRCAGRTPRALSSSHIVGSALHTCAVNLQSFRRFFGFLEASRRWLVVKQVKCLSHCPDRTFFELIPKLRNHDSCYPMLRGDDLIVNMSQIKQLDGGYKVSLRRGP